MRRASRLPLEQLQTYLLESSHSSVHDTRSLPAAEAPLDWHAVFGNDHPVEIEIGFGKGMFLILAAQTNPKVNYLGIEIERKYQLYAANRVAKRRLRNVRLLCGDARLFLRDRVLQDSVQGLHIYFPDPWWKTRHRKRRLFQEDFVRQCERVLRPGGRFRLLTDVEEYFLEIRKLLTVHTRLKELPPPPVKAPQHDLDYITNFERKYRKENRPIYRAEYEKQV